MDQLATIGVKETDSAIVAATDYPFSPKSHGELQGDMDPNLMPECLCQPER